MIPLPLSKQQLAAIKGRWEEERLNLAHLRYDLVTAARPRPDARRRPLPGTHPDYPYECLVFKGGGAKGAIYPGAVRALEDAGIMPYVKRFAGASAGAVTAALLAAGLSAEQLYIELATTDMYKLVSDQERKVAQMSDLVTKFGMNPGNALYKHLGTLFQRYLGCADITFQQLYDAYGVELAVAVTNISRAAVELLHAKTAPNYPIRKAVRMSMSLPVALRPCRDRNIHSVVSERILRLHHQMRVEEAVAAGRSPESVDEEDEDTRTPLEFYVDGGVLNNYPIDCFDGWWLSMDSKDTFFKKVIGTNGHKNYVERFMTHNTGTIGFRLASANEPDAMHSRLGNDALELKVRAQAAAYLPSTLIASKYAPNRDELTREAKARLKLDKELRASMDWLRKLRKEAADTAESATEPLDARLARSPPPDDVLSALGVRNLDEMLEKLREHHAREVRDLREEAAAAVGGGVAGTSVTSTRQGRPFLPRTPTVGELLRVLQEHPEAHDQVESLYRRTDLDNDSKLHEIQHIVLRFTPVPSAQGEQDEAAKDHTMLLDDSALPDLATACDEIEELLEMMAETLMKRMGGMEPKEISSLGSFINRLIEAIQSK